MAVDGSDTDRMVQLEKMAMNYIDSFIISRAKPGEMVAKVTMKSIEDYVDCLNTDLGAYIGQVNNFITTRNHLWRTSTTTTGSGNNVVTATIVEKLPAGMRAALSSILEYIEFNSTRYGPGGVCGAKLGNISGRIGQFYPKLKQELGTGLDGVKTFLMGFPALFTLLRFDPQRFEPSDMIFLNRAVIVKSVILLSTKLEEPTPVRLTGYGKLQFILPAQNFGFVQDENTKQDIYFPTNLVNIPQDTLQAHYKTRERYYFEAFISREFERGKAKSKWMAYRLVHQPKVEKDNDRKRRGPTERKEKTQEEFVKRNGIEKSGLMEELTGDATGVTSAYQCGPGNQPKQKQPCDPKKANLQKPFSRGSIGQNTTAQPTAVSQQQLPGALKNQPAVIDVKMGKRSVEKHDASCQTDVNEERQLLLRLIRQSPDLMKLVKVLKPGNY